MSWLRIDDGFVEHPKVYDLSDRAFRLHVAALCYSARNLTDGVLDKKRIAVLCAITKAKQRQITELIEAELWARDDEDCYIIRDYLDYNPDAETVKKRRSEAKERMRNLRGSPERSHEQNGEVTENVRTPRPVPSPTRPKEQDPKTHTGKVNGKFASQAEWAGAETILDAFNDVFGTRFAAREFLAKIVMRCREHPALSVDEHRAVIARAAAAPWWTDAPSPAVVYGNAGLFEKALSAVGTPVNGARPNMKYGRRAVSSAEMLALADRLQAEREADERKALAPG